MSPVQPLLPPPIIAEWLGVGGGDRPWIPSPFHVLGLEVLRGGGGLSPGNLLEWGHGGQLQGQAGWGAQRSQVSEVLVLRGVQIYPQCSGKLGGY